MKANDEEKIIVKANDCLHNQFAEDLKSLVIYMQNINEEGHFFELRNDLLVEAFSQLVGSARFASMDSQRRQNLFSQYQSLAFTLGKLEEFFGEYSDSYSTLVTGTYIETEPV
jgi:hypothetical protein